MRQFVVHAACLLALVVSLARVATAQDETDIAKLTASLESTKAADRAKAADELGGLGEKAQTALPALIKALGDDDKEVRYRTARAIGGFGSLAVDAVGPLTKALADDDVQVRAYAAFALGAIGEKSVAAAPALIKLAVDKDPTVRRAVIAALRKIKAPREITAPLVAEMLRNTDPTTVTAIIRTVAEAGEEAVPRMVEALQDKRTAYWAALALREIGPKAKSAVEPLVDVLKKNDEPEVRLQAALALAAIGPAAKGAVPALAATIAKDDFGGPKFGAAYALGEIGVKEVAIDALEKSVKSDDPFLALISAFSLARLEPDNKTRVALAIKHVISGLKSKDKNLRSAAARAMVEFKGHSAEVAPALVAALKDSSPEVIGNAIEALAAGGEKVVPAVSPGLANKDLRMLAARILARIGAGSKAAVPDLVKALAVDDHDFKREVQFTLGLIGPPAAPAVPQLIKSLAVEDEHVRNSAIFALGKIGPAAKEALPALRKNMTSEDVMLKRISVWAMLKIDKGNVPLAKVAVPLLAEGLKHESELVRYEAAVALGEIGEPAAPALPALKKAMEDPSAHVREAVAEAIKKIGK